MSVELLLGAIIDDGDTVSEESECECVFEEREVVGVIGESRLILIFGEGAEEGGVLAVGHSEVVFIFYT